MIGRLISHYKILEKLGEGGMGVVYKAEDLKLKRTVALKFLPMDLTRNTTAKNRFIQEAQAASAFDHPNICTIHEIDEIEDGQIFIVMSCYEGETLDKRIASRQVTLDNAIDLTLQIAKGLAKAHEHGIIHRDIKSANILITNDGVVKILDFGLAKLAGQPGITRTSFALGTPVYMSPEQVQGTEVDYRTDIWSLGVILYELLTSKLPFESEYDQAMMYKILNENPVEISSFRNDVPEYVEALCTRCLEKDKTRRPQTMTEVIELFNKKGSAVLKTTTKLPGHSWFKKIRIFIPVLFLLVVSGWFLISRILPPNKTPITKWRVAVLPFHGFTYQQTESDLPIVIQSLIVGELIGVDELMIIDPLSLNSLIENSFGTLEAKRELPFYQALRNINISFLIDGTILKSGNKYLIQSNIIDPGSNEIIFTQNTTMESEEDLIQSIRTLSNQILNYFQVKVLSSSKEKDLRPWLKYGSQHMGALKAFIQANQYNYRGEGPAAEKYLLRAIELDSSFISPRIWLISKLVEKEQIQDAAKHYQKLLSLQIRASPFEQVMIDWAGACIKKEIPLQARYLTIALDYSPQNNILLFSLARLLYIMEDYQGSIQALSNIIEMKFQYSPVYYLLGANYYQLEKYKESRDILEQSLSIRPVEPNIYSLLARLWTQNTDTTKTQYYENLYINSAAERGTPLNIIYANLAQQNYVLNRYDTAIKYFHQALSYDQNSPDYHQGLAEALYQKGYIEEAIASYLNTLKLNPDCADAHLMLGQMFEQRKETGKAVFHYRAYLELDSLSSKVAFVREHLSRLQQ